MKDQEVEFQVPRKDCEPCLVSVNLPGRLHSLKDHSVPVAKDSYGEAQGGPMLLGTRFIEVASIKCLCGNIHSFAVSGQKRKVYNEYCPNCGMKLYLHLGRPVRTVEQVEQPDGTKATAQFEYRSRLTNEHLAGVQEALAKGATYPDVRPGTRDIIHVRVDYDNKQIGIDFADGTHMGLVCHPRNNRRYRAMQNRREEKRKAKET
jgi:hypothetical protein